MTDILFFTFFFSADSFDKGVTSTIFGMTLVSMKLLDF